MSHEARKHAHRIAERRANPRFTYARLNIWDWDLHLVPDGQVTALCGCIPTFTVRGLALRPAGVCERCQAARSTLCSGSQAVGIR